MEKEATNFKDIVNYIPAGSVLLILISFVGNYFYYSTFNINIVNFFETSDYIALFFREVSEIWIYFFYFLIAITVFALINKYWNTVRSWFSCKKKKIDNKKSDSTEIVFFSSNKLNNISSGLLFGFVLLTIETALEIHFFNGFLFSVIGSIVLISIILFYWGDEIAKLTLTRDEKDEGSNGERKFLDGRKIEGSRIIISNINKSLSFTVFFGIVLVLVVKNIDFRTYQILAGQQPEFNYTIVFEGDTIRTDTNFVLLGTSKNYFFLFDLDSTKSLVYQTSDIKKITVQENPDFISFSKRSNSGIGGVASEKAIYLKHLNEKKKREKESKDD